MISTNIEIFPESKEDKTYSDDIAEFLNTNRDKILEAFYLSDISKPEVITNLKYRSLIPDFFNYTMNWFFASTGQEMLKIVEHEGKPHDWELLGKKISVKSVSHKFFKTNKRYGGRTKPKPIAIKNTNTSKRVEYGDFDYLLILSACKDDYSISLLDMNKVMKLLGESKKYNPQCDDNGYDQAGQIKMYVPSENDCLITLHMDPTLLHSLQEKYQIVSPQKRNHTFLGGISETVKQQIELSKRHEQQSNYSNPQC